MIPGPMRLMLRRGLHRRPNSLAGPWNARMAARGNLLDVGGIIADVDQPVVIEECVAFGDDENIVAVFEETRIAFPDGDRKA